MPDPTTYTRDFGFEGDQAASPTTKTPGIRIDDELDNVSFAISGLVAAVKDVRRSDGKLKNGSVEYETLAKSVRLAIGAPLLPAQLAGLRAELLARSPFDFLPITAKSAILNDQNAPTANAAFQAMFDEMAASGETNPEATIPAGSWYFDQAAELVMRSPGVNRTFTLNFEPGAKLIAPPANSYRYRVLGEWDAASNTPAITPDSGAYGDVWAAVTANDALSLGGVSSINVGDHIWRGPTGWQKVLAVPRYRYQAWNAATNLDESNNLTLQPGLGEEGDTIIVAKAGSASIDGISSWAVGDEAYFCLGKWRKKTVRGGTFKGDWNASTNTPALSNTNGAAGDWYVVVGPPAFAPVNNGAGQTGLGENIVFQPGDKVWCIAPGRWRKVYASPTPRGTWDLDGTYQTQFYPASGSTDAAIGKYALANQGAYGDLFTVTETGQRSVNGVSRVWSRGEFLFRGPNGHEIIARDPNWDRGIFRFLHDDKSAMVIRGRVNFVSRSDGRGSDLSSGWAARSHSLYRPNYQNYLFQNIMLDIEDVYAESDNADSGLAQFASGVWEGIWETRNLYLPTLRSGSLRTTQSDGSSNRLTSLVYQPRRSAYGIRHVDSYVAKCFSLHLNGDYGCAYAVDSEVWDSEKTSWEGGEVCIDGCAGAVDIVSIRHALRMAPSFPEPTFFVELKDTNYSRYGVRVHGHQGVDIVMGVPILPGDGGSVHVVAKPAFCFIEDAGAVTIRDGLPTGSQYTDADRFSSLVKTRGAVFGVTLDAINFSQMKAGVIFDLGHNANGNAQALNQGPAVNPAVYMRGCSHIGVDTAGRKLVVGRAEYLDGVQERLRILANGGVDFSFMEGANALVMKNGQVHTLSDAFDVVAFGQRILWRRKSDGKPIMSLDTNGNLRVLAAPIVVSDVTT